MFAFRGRVGGQKNARFTTKKCKLGGGGYVHGSLVHGQMPKNANVICEGSLIARGTHCKDLLENVFVRSLIFLIVFSDSLS